jgi:hypothetical protein
MDILKFLNKAEYLEVINLKDTIFNIGFCIGIVKYLTTERPRDESTQNIMSAISCGLFNGIRIVLLSAFVPVHLRIVVPIMDSCFLFAKLFGPYWQRLYVASKQAVLLFPGVCMQVGSSCRKLSKSMSRAHIKYNQSGIDLEQGRYVGVCAEDRFCRIKIPITKIGSAHMD